MPGFLLPSVLLPAAPQVQSGSVVNSLMLGVYRFWRSQAPVRVALGSAEGAHGHA